MSTKSLWGNLQELEIVRTPRTILKEQAQFLTEATDGVLVGQVREDFVVGREEIIGFDLEITVPALNNYRYSVLTVQHNVDPFPVRVIAQRPQVDKSCNDETEFVSVLEALLSSAEMKRIISRLVSQAS